MSAWLEKAKEVFQDLIPRFENADTPYLLWFELNDAFDSAYEKIPHDESLISRIYQYSDWCMSQPQGQTAEDDLATCVAVCFYEHIPLCKNARLDMPRWWHPKDLDHMKEIFSYHLGDDGFAELKKLFSRERSRYNPALRVCARRS